MPWFSRQVHTNDAVDTWPLSISSSVGSTGDGDSAKDGEHQSLGTAGIFSHLVSQARSLHTPGCRLVNEQPAGRAEVEDVLREEVLGCFLLL